MAEFESRVEKVFRRLFPLYEHIELRVESASNGIFRCSVPLNERNSNHFQTVHAALQWASAEVLGGLVFVASGLDAAKYLGVVKSFQIDFERPAGTAIVAEARFSQAQMDAMKSDVQDHGRADYELVAVVRNASGKTVAETTGLYAVRTMRDPSSG